MTSVPSSALIIVAAALCALAAAIAVAYWKFPLHLIYKSKLGYESMLDAIGDPLAVVSSDYTVIRANKAYMALVAGSFPDSIGQKCYRLLRGRSEPCDDCLLSQTLDSNKPHSVEHSPHPSGKGALRLGFSPYSLDTAASHAACVIEHIRDITLLEQLKTDLEGKNRSLAEAMRTLKLAQRSIREDLRLARQIQEGILPKNAPAVPGISIALT
jgi:hypothetical protein